MAEARRRKPVKAGATPSQKHQDPAVSEARGVMEWIRRQPLWIVLAIASGTCAAVNGVFAKLTTTALTSTFASNVASTLDLAEDNPYVNLVLRATFFGLNILFNIAMWALFTAALTRASSTTRVSIVNVSSNFFITAILGAMIFGEKLPLTWWLGAGLLAAGNVVIGRREETEKPSGNVGLDETRRAAQEAEDLLADEPEEDLLQLRQNMDRDRVRDAASLKAGEDADNPI